MTSGNAIQGTSFSEFITGMTALVESKADEQTILARGRALLALLVASDNWLPPEFAAPKADCYGQYLLHRDPVDRYSVLSFVWGPGQRTPVHDHTVWGLVGVLRGRELCEEYVAVTGIPTPTGESRLLNPGDIDAVSPTVGDWHRVSNSMPNSISISIHVYGADIGKVERHMLDGHGEIVNFISGYTD